MAQVAAAMGWDLLPWQRQVLDTACEVTDTGAWRYPTVIVTTPRQSGKSTLLGAMLAHRAITQRDSYHWYTAQTGLSARDTWGKWEYKLSESMPGRWKIRRAAGEERCTFTASNGFIRAFPPTPKALHGQQGDTVVVDECWSFRPDSGADLLQAVVPTQATRRLRQLWIVSTAGDEEAVWFRSWIDRGRAAVDDPASQIAYFEWSAPDDAPIMDEATWRTYHPGYPTLIDGAAMAAAYDQFGPEGYSRGYLNRWPAAEVSWRAGWPALASTDRIPPDLPVYLAVDASPNHRQATIAAAATLPDGRIAVEIVDQRTGTEWLVPRLLELSRRHRAAVTVHRTGPLGYAISELETAGVRVHSATAAEYGDAVARFRTLAAASGLTHPDDPRLNSAVDNAVSRRTGDRETWSRRDAGTDISSLVAVTFAAWRAADPPPAPVVASLRA